MFNLNSLFMINPSSLFIITANDYTVEQLVELLPIEYQEKVLKNYNGMPWFYHNNLKNHNIIFSNLSDIIQHLFIWSYSIEGSNYWHEVSKKLKTMKINTNPTREDILLMINKL